MPEHLRALIVIIALEAVFFAIAERTISNLADNGDFTRRRNLWFLLTLAAFLSHGFWLYMLVAVPLLAYAFLKEINPPALFFFLLFILPTATIQIPGMGLINFVFDISHARMLALIILLPAFLSLQRSDYRAAYGRIWPDRLIAAYLVLSALLTLRDPSLTNSFRQTFYLFTDILLPYYVVSRSLKTAAALVDALSYLALAILSLTPLAIFEAFKHWLLYAYVTDALGLHGMMGYLGRDGMLRSVVTGGQAIVLGYLMAIGMGLYMFLGQSIRNKIVRRLGLALLLAGLIAPLSRGPWVGTGVLFVVFIVTGPKPVRGLFALGLSAILAISLMTALPSGQKLINLLPFIGSTEKSNIDYREQLITNSLTVIQRNPWVGSADYLKTPEMEAMRQGQGIIDIVNSYIYVALESGYIGLGLFIGFFASTLWGVYGALRSISNRHSREYLLGRVLLSTLMGILIIIFTVSSISFIPIVYWSLAGLCVAYARIIKEDEQKHLLDAERIERSSRNYAAEIARSS